MKKYYLLFILLSTFLFSNAQSPVLDSVVTTTPIVCNGDLGIVTAYMSQSTPGTPVKLLNYKYAGALLFPFGSSGLTSGSTQPFTDLPAFSYRMFMVDSIPFYTAFPGTVPQSELQNPTDPSIFGYMDYTVSEPSELIISYSITNVSCNGGTDGFIDLTASGSSGTYTYVWNTGATTEDVSGLTAGTYSATVTDSWGCTANTGAIAITEPNPLIPNGQISLPISGNGNFNGQITASVSGGTAPYQYSINNGAFQSNPVFSNLGVGTYQITYKDINNCMISEMIILTQPPPVSGNISILNSVSCNGYCDGALQFNVIGGTSPFTYSLNNGPFQSNNQFSNLCGDSLYSITVKDDNSSTFVDTVYLNQPNLLTFNINASGVSCNWDCDGVISINNVSGGAGAPITYSFDGGNTFSQIWSTMNLCPNDYYIAVQDGSGCIVRDTVSFTTPDSLIIVSLSSTNISCFGGTDGDIQVDSVVGGGMPYTYSISDTASTYCSWSGGPSGLCSLGAGEYYIEVIDANGCLVQDSSVILTQPSEMVVSFSVQNNFMPYDNSAAISTTISGGTQPYQVDWIGPNGFSNNNEDIDFLFSGTYYVTISDANGCTINDTIEINEPGVIVGCTDSTALNFNAVANIDNGLCYYCTLNANFVISFPTTQFACDGWIAAPVAPGQGTITWYWSNGISGGLSANAIGITGLCNDTFSVTIISSTGCGTDTTILLSNYIGCTDSSMFNYDPLALFDDGSCITIVNGCTDSTAFNYNPSANTNDTSCVPFVYGCMDTLALNYNPLANTNDGSCVLPILGCMDSTAINYNPLANVSDGSCNAIVYGCTDPIAANYNPLANIDDNSCWFCTWGCIDSSAWNYNPLATCNDSLCVPFIYGCTDPFSFNYNVSANTDDGSCLATVYGCTDSLAYNYNSLANFDDGSCYNCSFSTPVWYIDSTNIDSCQVFAWIYTSSINTGLLSYTWNTILGTFSSPIPSFPYANNLCLGVYSITVEDSYGCSISDTITIGNINLGCTDPVALNYDSLATLDDGSCCLPAVVDLTIGIWNFVFDWGCNGNDTLYYIDYNSNGTWSNSYSGLWELCGVNYTHSYFVDQTVYTGTYSNGVITGTMTDNISNNTGCFSIYLDSLSVTLGCMDMTALNYNPLAVLDDGSCTYSGCTDLLACNYDSTASADDGSCILPNGCTDLLACNYDSTATCDDGSCLPGGCTDSTMFNYDPLATCDDGSCIYIIYGCTDSTAVNYYAGANVDDGTCLYMPGCTDSTANNYNPLADTDDGSCTYDVYGCTISVACNYAPLATIDDGLCILPDGCTDPAATNYNASATCDDGSCTYGTTCSAITGVNLTDVIHDRATFNWNDMNSATCVVDQIRIRYREVGASSYTNKTMGAPVGNNAPCLNTSKLVLNLIPSTLYEYDFKIWYQDGTVVNWHANGSFTTADVCVNATNMTATPTSTTQAQFCWDAPAAPWSFVRLKYRENSIGSSFSNIGGFGVMAPALCKTKNGLASGYEFRVMWRTWCNVTGGPYRSPVWDGPVIWSQPSSIRLEGGTTINNLEVYPNPSRGVFNVRFTSETIQDLKVRILTVIGEEISSDDLQEFIGEYTKQIDLTGNAKGVYFLEIETNDGLVNKKLFLQ